MLSTCNESLGDDGRSVIHARLVRLIIFNAVMEASMQRYAEAFRYLPEALRQWTIDKPFDQMYNKDR